MNCELFITWNPSLEVFSIGAFSMRWYSLMWLIGLALAYLMVRWLYKKQGIANEKFEPLFIYCFMGILVGARLGHCIFYQPDYFLTSWKGVIEMLLPIKIDAMGGWHMIGYQGLASHGGTLGLIITLLLYVRRFKVPVWTVLDNIAIATGITACCIRIGNLMNSEIVGKITDESLPWAFWFVQNDGPQNVVLRHPGQLYEAIAYALLFALMFWLYKKMPQRVGTGFYFGLCLAYIFTFRFFIEYFKEVQEAFEEGLPFDMGQILSIPFIIIGVYCMVKGLKKA
ncbi:prolipoprotein diacylglyceryl transferase [Prevotella sp. E15-22]|uniref:prolipoprotein diacylglyceryl transferase n=1 Tax=Prevotella sp. E15-22 TaxID=2937774 RepID=UPI0020468F50|nr:prolipoprotein diacylglyceryl transferase [Prevotella sp. E15-22]UPS44549.1 prolipoprotein diacylglyceryl transferase [Prevotella sp. E15-22]